MDPLLDSELENRPLKLLVLGAHPDDAEFRAGGLALRYRSLGHQVRFVSVTDGRSGHATQHGASLVERRRKEAVAAARVLGVENEVWDYPDGALQPDLGLRHRIIREIRMYEPDLVLTHRPEDYHPDHRALGQAVRDASYMVTVPAVVPAVPHLRRDPVVGYMVDGFTRPSPIHPDVIHDITPLLDTLFEAIACHESQVFEWLPYNKGIEAEVPPAGDSKARQLWLREVFGKVAASLVDRYPEAIRETYGSDLTGRTHFEVFEISEYAGGWNPETRRRLFPFLY